MHFFGPSTRALEDKLGRHIQTIESYSERQAACVPKRERKLLFGIKAGLRLPLLVEAVRMLYIDVLPLRVGGDIIMGRLAEKIQEGSVRTKPTIPDEDLVLASSLFDKLDVDGSGTVSEAELRAVGLTDPAVAEIMDEFSSEGEREIGFFQFLADRSGDNEPDIFKALGRHFFSADATQAWTPVDLKAIIDEISSNLAVTRPSHEFEVRFNRILQFIVDLEHRLEGRLNSNKRMKVILQGSFEAAKDSAVVDALRSAYCEIGSIRIAGDLIFGLVSRFIAP